ncbi:hypothetical protein UlMin_026550 [Ulmus minor]
MAKPSLLPLLFLFYITGSAIYATAAPVQTSNFIKSSCRATTYPAVCIQSLSSYASNIKQDPHQLAITALSVSLDRAQSAKTFVSKMNKFKGLKKREYAAIKDCFEEMGDSVDRLTESIKELKGVGKRKGKDFLWHMSNVQTWVSSAITDENTCLDGFSGRTMNGKIKASVRARVLDVARVTSNALALCNQLAAKN